MWLPISVTPEPIVVRDLLRGQHPFHTKVSLEVSHAEATLEDGNAGYGIKELWLVDLGVGEQSIEPPLRRDDLGTEPLRLDLHGIEDRPHVLALWQGEPQRARQLENMPRARVTVQLSGLCKTQPIASQVGRHLFRCESLDLAVLLPGVGRWSHLSPARSREYHE